MTKKKERKTVRRWDGGEGTPCVLITARHKHCAWRKNSGSLAGGRGTVGRGDAVFAQSDRTLLKHALLFITAGSPERDCDVRCRLIRLCQFP